MTGAQEQTYSMHIRNSRGRWTQFNVTLHNALFKCIPTPSDSCEDRSKNLLSLILGDLAVLAIEL